MKLIYRRPNKWDLHGHYDGRYKKCVISIRRNHTGMYYCLIQRKADDKRYNSLWNKAEFETIEQAAEFGKEYVNNFIGEEEQS